MISIKKICVLVSITTFFLTQAGAETKSLSFSPTVGFLYGQADEIVYKYPYSDLYLSELLWDMKPLFYLGFAADFGPSDTFQQQGFTAALSLNYGFPLRTGMLHNRDWLNYNFNYPTHYSRHDVYNRLAIIADVSAGYSWNLATNISLKAYGEFSYMRLSWSGKDGYAQYPTYEPNGNYPKWEDSIPKTYGGFKGEIIRYTQNWFILAPGVSLKWKPFSLFSFEGNINYSPLIYCFAKDEHFLRSMVFYDHPFLGHYFNGSVELTFLPGKNTDFSFSFSYKNISGTRGDSFVDNVLYRQTAGAGYSAYDLSLAVKMRLPSGSLVGIFYGY